MSFWEINRKLSWAFVLISIFLTAQLVWWIFFFSYQSKLLFSERKSRIDKTEKFLRSIANNIPKNYRKHLINSCKKFFSEDIQCEGGDFSARQVPLYQLESQRRRYLRMLIVEGLFFFAMIIAGLFLLWQGLKLERELKEHQQNFLSAISHELRTPIGTLKLLLDTLLTRPIDSEKRRKYLQKMARQLQSLENTCEQLLAAASLNRYREEKFVNYVEVNSVISGILEKKREQLREVSLHWRPHPSPVYLALPHFYIELILFNLIDNALKYNTSENKRLYLAVEVDEKSLHIYVEDNGPGIPPEELNRLYHPFYRLERDRKRRGLGLGLYIVRTLCQDSGGEISYQRLDGGSRFVLSWPLSRVKFEGDGHVALET